MKKPLAVLVACGSLVSSLALNYGTASAYTSQQSPKYIYLNGSLTYSPDGFAAIDPASGQATTYFPIWYVMQVLNSFGVQNTWDGHNWNFTTPNGMSISSMPSSLYTSDSNRRNIILNSQVVETPYAIVTTDQSSGSQTTYIPIWYIMQILNALGIQNSWNGANWDINYYQPQSSTNAIVISMSSNTNQMLANGASNNITVRVLDSTGNPLSSFSGTVDVSLTQNQVTYWTTPVTITNGVGYLTLTPTSGSTTGTFTLTTSNLQGSPQENYTTYTSLSLTIAPKVAVILLMGLSSSLNSETYNPVSSEINYGTLYTQATATSYPDLYTLENYFDKYYSGSNSNLTKSIAQTGAIILPFSYNGVSLTLQNGTPSLKVNGYSPKDVGYMLPDPIGNQAPQGTAAYQLNEEVQSIQQMWPQTKIVIIGHSEGGLVAERYFMDYYSPSTAPNVDKIFSLDSPINGINGGAISSIMASILSSKFWLSDSLLNYYNNLWDQFQIYGDSSVVNKNNAENNIYTPIGTPGDLIYSSTDDGYHSIFSQILFPAPLQTSGTNTEAKVDLVTPEGGQYGHPSLPGGIFNPLNILSISSSHFFVTTSDTVINWLTNTVISAENANSN